MSQILEEKLHIKIYIENDTRSMAYGEYLQGVVKGEKNILFINISWGLGIGIIIDGKVYFGKSGFSGEFGHFSFFENEILCHCGKKDASRLELPVLPCTVPSLSGIKRVATPYWPVKSMPGNTSGSLT